MEKTKEMIEEKKELEAGGFNIPETYQISIQQGRDGSTTSRHSYLTILAATCEVVSHARATFEWSMIAGAFCG